jgi:acid phosphatase
MLDTTMLSRRSLLMGLAAGAGLVCFKSAWADMLPNLGEEKAALLKYQQSGQYLREIAAIAAEAQAYLAAHPLNVVKPALVLDIDETALSNWREIRINDFGYIPNGSCDIERGPCGVNAWEQMGAADAITPVLELFKSARARNIDVFFITGRKESHRAATAANLRSVGFDGFTAVAHKPDDMRVKSAADYKAPERAKIAAAGYTILANVGDQPSDLAGGYAERAFLLPNPFYRIP